MPDLTPKEAADIIEIHNLVHARKESQAIFITKAMDLAIHLLRKIASGEYAPVVHAHWIDYMADKKDWLRDDGKTVFIECSVCHEKLCRNLMLSEKYCPYCGAIMDEREDNHEAD
mgnify:CR=1 FL=1